MIMFVLVLSVTIKLLVLEYCFLKKQGEQGSDEDGL